MQQSDDSSTEITTDPQSIENAMELPVLESQYNYAHNDCFDDATPALLQPRTVDAYYCFSLKLKELGCKK